MTARAARAMAQLSKSRPLNEKERELLDFMFTADFRGRDELKKQASSVEVCWECDCGCGTVEFELKEPYIRAAAHEPIPVEGYGEGVDVSLFVKQGLLSSLEIVNHGDGRPLTYPNSRDLQLWVPPHRTVGDAPAKDSS
jgi:hypothetical protein